MEYEYIYYWYHKMKFSFLEQFGIAKILDDHEYEAFMALYSKYRNEGCFPNDILVVDKSGNMINKIDVTVRENFEKITWHEGECGLLF